MEAMLIHPIWIHTAYKEKIPYSGVQLHVLRSTDITTSFLSRVFQTPFQGFPSLAMLRVQDLT